MAGDTYRERLTPRAITDRVPPVSPRRPAAGTRVAQVLEHGDATRRGFREALQSHEALASGEETVDEVVGGVGPAERLGAGRIRKDKAVARRVRFRSGSRSVKPCT